MVPRAARAAIREGAGRAAVSPKAGRGGRHDPIAPRRQVQLDLGDAQTGARAMAKVFTNRYR